ncbi:MAG: substrate-binding domain-containing protein [Opitutales bacterium]|nr:substrate-binding domain-containing protein [Opitutales bacterium]
MMKRRRAVVILSPLNLRRLARGLAPWVARGWEFVPVPLDRPVESILRLISGQKADGVLVEFDIDLVESVFAFGKPTVVLFADLIVDGAVCVNVDDYAVGQLAAQHLLERGLRRFAYCGRATMHAPERMRGYRDSLREAGLTVSVFEEATAAAGAAGPVWQEPSARLQKWLQGLAVPCGIFAAHDSLGRTLAEGAARIGRRIPDDIAILSASDDALVCEMAEPPLSCVALPWERIADAAAGWLDRLVSGKAAPEDPVRITPTTVITRASTEVIAVGDPLVERALRHARDNLRSLQSVDQWVRALGTNRRQLERTFRAATRESPYSALIRLRVLRARDYLIQTDASLVDIAELCGFSRPEKLSHHFRRVTGEPPSKVRRRERRVVEVR